MSDEKLEESAEDQPSPQSYEKAVDWFFLHAFETQKRSLVQLGILFAAYLLVSAISIAFNFNSVDEITLNALVVEFDVANTATARWSLLATSVVLGLSWIILSTSTFLMFITQMEFSANSGSKKAQVFLTSLKDVEQNIEASQKLWQRFVTVVIVALLAVQFASVIFRFF